jgi:hypothetical protein
MAYAFAAASSRYLSTASAPASGSPLTIAAWLRPTAVAAMRAVVVGVNGGTHRNQLGLYTPGSNVGLQAASVGTNGVFVSQTDANTSSGTLIHGCAVFASATSRTAYLNGTAAATNTNNVGTQNAADAVSIGAGWSTTIGGYHSGDIAEVGIWDVALTAAEIASLAKGFTCDKVRPGNLVFYAPLIRDLIDKVGGLTITNNNSATVANHPRVYG